MLYDKDGDETEIIDPTGATTFSVYDPLDRQVCRAEKEKGSGFE